MTNYAEKFNLFAGGGVCYLVSLTQALLEVKPLVGPRFNPFVFNYY